MCVSEEICYAVHSYWPFLDYRPVQVGLELGHDILLLWMCVSEEICYAVHSYWPFLDYGSGWSFCMRIHTWGPPFIVSSKGLFHRVHSLTGEILRWAQSLARNSHPFIWWPHSIELNFVFRERVLLLCTIDSHCWGCVYLRKCMLCLSFLLAIPWLQTRLV